MMHLFKVQGEHNIPIGKSRETATGNEWIRFGPREERFRDGNESEIEAPQRVQCVGLHPIKQGKPVYDLGVIRGYHLYVCPDDLHLIPISTEDKMRRKYDNMYYRNIIITPVK